MRVYIVCRPCPDGYYDGSPTGVVFSDIDKATAYLLEQNGPDMPDEYALYLRKGEMK